MSRPYQQLYILRRGDTLILMPCLIHHKNRLFQMLSPCHLYIWKRKTIFFTFFITHKKWIIAPSVGHALKNQKSIYYHLHIRTFKKRKKRVRQKKKKPIHFTERWWVGVLCCAISLQIDSMVHDSEFWVFQAWVFSWSLCGFWALIFIFRYLAIYISLSFINFKWLWLSSAYTTMWFRNIFVNICRVVFD